MGDPILDLAAKLYGCKRSELIEVRDTEDGSLSVIALNWQRKTFSAEEIAAAQTWDIVDGELITPIVTIDLSDGISDEEAALAERVLAQRKAESENDAPQANLPKKSAKKRG